MNTNRLAENHFVEGAASAFRVPLFQIALEFAQKNHKVLYVARQPLDRLPVEDDTLSACILRNIIFQYASTVDELRKVILSIHSLALAPKLLIIDSLQEFFNDAVADINERMDMDHVMYAALPPLDYARLCTVLSMITACTQNAVDSMSCRLRATCASIISIDFDAISTLREHRERFGGRYFDLYYFKASNRHNGSDNFDSLRQQLLDTL